MLAHSNSDESALERVAERDDDRADGLLAAIAGGLCTHLVVGAHMAGRLLEHAGAASKKAS